MRQLSKVIALAITVLMLCSMLIGCAEKTSNENEVQVENVEDGKLVVTVVDKDTKKPISEANVIIVGLETKYKTDEYGASPEIALKVNKDMYKKYGDDLYSKVPSGSVAVLITKDGYKDYLMFNKAIYPGHADNTLNVQLSKVSQKDSQESVVDFQFPHNIWVQELINYCDTLKSDNPGDGETKLTFSIKDQNKKPVQDAVITIPELGVKAKTDKNGAVVLNPSQTADNPDLYPVKRDFADYTIVVEKEGYLPSVMFNVTANTPDGNIPLTLKASKDKSSDEINISYYPYEKEWVKKIVDNYKVLNNNTDGSQDTSLDTSGKSSGDSGESDE